MQQGGAGPEPHSRLAAPHPDCTCRTDVSAPCAPLHTRSASTAQARQTERYIEALRQQLKHEVYLLWLYLLWLYLLWLAAQARVGPHTAPAPSLTPKPTRLACRQVALRPRPLPPLCACGLDPLDNHVQRCARNCLFHKNPAAYSRALSGLISRTIKLEAPRAVA